MMMMMMIIIIIIIDIIIIDIIIIIIIINDIIIIGAEARAHDPDEAIRARGPDASEAGAFCWLLLIF